MDSAQRQQTAELGAELKQSLGLDAPQAPQQPQAPQAPQAEPRGVDPELEQALRDHVPDEEEQPGGSADVLGEDFNFLDLPDQPMEQPAAQEAPQEADEIMTAGQIADHVSPGLGVIAQAQNSVGTQLAMIQESLERQEMYLQSQHYRELEEYDPGEAALLRVKMAERRDELVNAYQHLQPAAREIMASFANENRRRFMGQCQAQIPEWLDPKTAQAEITAMRDHAKRNLGYNDQQLSNIWNVAEIKSLRDSWLKHQATAGTGQQQQRARRKLYAKKKQGFNETYDRKVKALEKSKRGRVSDKDKYHALAKTLVDLGYSV